MALARIFTRFAPDSQPLAEDLRARGFEVQTRSPEEAPSGPADLEITLEECAPEEALKRAVNTPDAQGMYVFIAPGAMTENPQPMRVVPLIPEPGAIARPAPVPIANPVLSIGQADREPGEAANDMELPPETVEELRAVASAPEPLMPAEQLAAAFQAEAPAEAVLAEPRAEPIRIVLPAQSAPDRVSIRGYKIPGKRFFSSDKGFWRAATVAGIAAVAALLLVASSQRFSPLPPGLVQSSADLQQGVPLAKAKRSAAAPSRATQAAAAAVKPAAALDPSTPGMNETGIAETKTAEGHVTPASAEVRSKPRHPSAYGTEEDLVAKDTVIRYGSQPPPPGTQTQKRPEIKHYSDLK